MVGGTLGTPPSRPGWGVPWVPYHHPHLARGGTLGTPYHPHLAGGYPGYPPTIKTWPGYPPIQTWLGYPPPHTIKTWPGYPLPTIQTWLGYSPPPPPSRPDRGTPPPPSRCELTNKLKTVPFPILRMRAVISNFDHSRITLYFANISTDKNLGKAMVKYKE